MAKNNSDIRSGWFPAASFLLVDDDQEHLEMLDRSLSDMGFATQAVADGEEAVALCRQERFNVVIADIQMPRMDGFELLRIIKKEYEEIDVILMTGFSRTYTFTDVIRGGATDYLEKPFTRDALRAKIFRILKERALLAGYNRELAQRREMEATLQRKSADLEKRVRELNCLYRVSGIMEEKKERLDILLRAVAEAIPAALRYPERAAARIRHHDFSCCTTGFRQTPWTLRAAIRSRGEEVGEIEVCYDEEIAGDAGGFFPEEERNLIAEIADKTGQAIDRQRAEEDALLSLARLEETVRLRTRELSEAQTALEAVFQNIPDGILSVDGQMMITHVNEQCRRYLDATAGTVFHPGQSCFQRECRRLLQTTLSIGEVVTDYRVEIRQDKQPGQVVLVSTSLLRDSGRQVSGALLIIHDITRLADLEKQLLERRKFREIIGSSPQIRQVYDTIRRLASVDTTVLITGESGTGKELLVETLHAGGDRADRPLIKVNCAALPETLLESELFGHIRGAFTGAVKDRTGRIEAAEGGILFLDEIGDISPRIQLKLLRFLETKEYERVGESRTRRADVRIFAATNADLVRKVEEGLFREDLYYRLKVMVLTVPPLRERKEDIPLLVDHFLALFNQKFHKSIAGVSPEVRDILMRYDWPGNIRELKHVLEHAVLLSSGHELLAVHLPGDLCPAARTLPPDGQPARALTREALLNALRQSGGNKAKTARILKMSRATLYNKIREFNLEDRDWC